MTESYINFSAENLLKELDGTLTDRFAAIAVINKGGHDLVLGDGKRIGAREHLYECDRGITVLYLSLVPLGHGDEALSYIDNYGLLKVLPEY